MRGFVLTLGLVAIAATGLGQGSIGGFGGGMGGGGNATMSADFLGRFDKFDKSSDISDSSAALFADSEWSKQTMIATAGIGCDWKFEGKAGEVLVAEARSDVFDSSIKIFDEKGKLLRENDDRTEGNQSPLIIYRFEKDQTIRLNVGSFKNASGGKFELRHRLYPSFTVPLGGAETPMPGTEEAVQQGGKASLIHFRCKKGQTYTYGTPTFFDKNHQLAGAYGFARFFGPSGISKSDLEIVSNGTNEYRTFKALADGDYFVEFYLNQAYAFAKVPFSVVKSENRETVGKTSHVVAPQQQLIIKFPVVPNEIITTSFSCDREDEVHYIEGPEIPKDQRIRFASSGNGSDNNWGVSSTFTWFRLKKDSDTLARTFFVKGEAMVVLTNESDSPARFTIENDSQMPEFKPATDVEANLAIGESQLYTYESAKNEMMRLRCTGTTFSLHIQIFDYFGRRLNHFTDEKNNTPGDDLYFPEKGKFLFRVSCVGDGGSGAYTLRRDPIGTTALILGQKANLLLDGKSFGVYEVALEAGKRYSLTSDFSSGSATFMTMFEDGVVLRPNSHQYDNIRTDILKVEKSGKYRIWVRGGGNANVTFKITPYKPPTIDD
ncbi:MAG: hypothetical protein WCK51_03020 [Armatimonadota bacterium]